MLTFYYTRNVLRCWIKIHPSKQFNYAYMYPIYALRTGFSNCWFFFYIFLNLKYIKVGYMYKWLRSSWCLICNVTIKLSCYKMGQILVKHLVIFFKSYFYGCYCSDERFDPKCYFFVKKALKITNSSMSC